MKFRLPLDIVILDLEMNQPSGTIIEIGAVRFLRDGGIHPEKFDIIVNPNETLGTCQTRSKGTISITELTTITQEMIDKAVQLDVAIQKMHEWTSKESPNFVLAGWGGDPSWLRTEVVNKNIPYPFRNKSFDIKSMVVIIAALLGKKYKTDGLSSMMKCFNVKFEGTKHRADSDAYNTARLLQAAIVEYNQKIDLIERGLKGLGRLK